MPRTFLAPTIDFSFLFQVSLGTAANSDENFVATPYKPSVMVPSNETTDTPTTERLLPKQIERLNCKKDPLVNEEHPLKVLIGPLTPFFPLYIDP